MTLEKFLIIANIPVALYLIGCVIVLINLRAKQQHIKLLGLFCFLPLIAHTGNYILYQSGINPNYSGSIYSFIAFNLITLIYYYALDRKHAYPMILAAGLFSLFAIINLLFIQKADINSYTLIVESIFVLCYVLYYFYWLMRELPTTQLQRLPMFWINSAWLIYFAGNFFLYSFTSYLVNVLNNDLLLYWTIHNFLSAFVAIMMILALWIDLRNIKSPS